MTVNLLPDMAALVVDPDLGARPFEIIRRKGQWNNGRLVVSDELTIEAIGNIQPPTDEQLSFFPEGERREGKIAIYTPTGIYLTRGEQISDTVRWQGETYRIIAKTRWEEHGFIIAFGQKED